MRRTVSNSLLLLAALIWGTTFVAQQLGMHFVGPLSYTGARFLLGALVVSPLAWREYLQLCQRGVVLHRADALAWCALGLLLFLGAICQQLGIAGTSVSNAGFLTALYVPLVPMLAWLIDKKRPHGSVWAAAIGSFIGTFLLSGGQLMSFSAGDWWVIVSTLFWAAHVFFVGRVAAKKGAPLLLAWTQFLVCGILASVLAGLNETLTLANLQAGAASILYAGVLSVGVGFTLQVVAQRHTHPADAAILLSSEILFAAIAAALYLGERLDTFQLLGGLLIFVSIVAVQLAPE